MTAAFRFCICLLLWLVAGQIKAQQPDSARTQPADSVAALRAFNADTGPAEAVFSLVSPPPYRFNSGEYAIADPAFPLLFSPDSLICQPIRRAHRQRRKARIALIATAVPLTILMYTVSRFVFSLGTVATGRSSAPDLPGRGLLRASGVASLVGITVTATFNIATLSNLTKGIKRHNRQFGRRMPTIFNPRGL